jgi:hypothetical protein
MNIPVSSGNNTVSHDSRSYQFMLVVQPALVSPTSNSRNFHSNTDPVKHIHHTHIRSPTVCVHTHTHTAGRSPYAQHPHKMYWKPITQQQQVPPHPWHTPPNTHPLTALATKVHTVTYTTVYKYIYADTLDNTYFNTYNLEFRKLVLTVGLYCRMDAPWTEVICLWQTHNANGKACWSLRYPSIVRLHNISPNPNPNPNSNPITNSMFALESQWCTIFVLLFRVWCKQHTTLSMNSLTAKCSKTSET